MLKVGEKVKIKGHADNVFTIAEVLSRDFYKLDEKEVEPLRVKVGHNYENLYFIGDLIPV